MKFKVTYHTLETLCNMYDAVKEYNACYPSEIILSKEYKAVMDIIDILFLKLKKKLLSKLPTSKPFALEFQYHQQYYLMNFMSANIGFINGIREQNLMLSLSNKIHQHL